MKKRHLFFFFLKIIIVIQFILILLKKQTAESKTYIATEIVFKLTLGIFIDYYIFHNVIDEILFEDKLIISFAGGLLCYDAIFNDLPKLLAKFDIYIDIPFFQKKPITSQ